MLVKVLRSFIESLRRVTDGAEAFLILTLFILCLDKVSTEHAKLVPLGKVTQTYKKPFQSNTCSSNLSNYLSSLQALISLIDDHSLLSNMAALESCPKHNMIVYMEKTEGNVEFHEVIDFLQRSYIFHALTVSPVISTTFVEQFWTSAKSKTINNVRHITAKVAGKVVSISEASIRTDLIFDDADGIDSLPNQAIFNAIQRMGYEGDLSRQLASISVPLDHFPVNSLTSKVFSFMIKKGKHFSGKVTPLFDTMLVQPTQDEGASSERLSVEQSSPSPAPTGEVPNESLPDSSSAQPSEVPFEQQHGPSPRPSPRPSPTPTIPDSIPEPSGENLGDHSSNDTSLLGNEDDMTLPNVYDLCISLCQQVTDQAKEIKILKAKIKKLKKQAKPVIKHFKAYLKTVSLQQRLSRKSSSKKQRMHKKNVSKQGRKIAKGGSSVQRDPMFDVMPEDNIDHMEVDQHTTRACTIRASAIQSMGADVATKRRSSEFKRSLFDEDESESDDDADIPQAVRKFNQFESDEESWKESSRRMEASRARTEQLTIEERAIVLMIKLRILATKPQFDESKRLEEINLNVVTRSIGQKRYFSTLITVLSVFDREDLDAGDLIIMFNPDEQDEFWNSQHEWKVISWKLHSSSGVHTLMTEEGLVIHMLIEKKYPLKKEIVVQMLKLKLESEEESTMALELIRFIKKVLADLESKDED
ncbi:hypothetical protein Tco_0996844 [Tanacetum coccineum]